MLSFLADEDPDLFVKMCYQTSTNPPNKLIPSLEVLEKLKGINPEAWAEVGGNATLAYLMRESRQADLRTEFAMTLLAYYQEHQDELVEQLMKPNVDAKVYLPLASGLFTEENYQKLLQAITQTPGQLVDKAAWAAQHVGELEAGGTNGGRKLKVRTRKVEKEGPGIA
jgi:hypothetical protein